MNKPKPNLLDGFDPEAPRKQILCKIVQIESVANATDMIVTCEIRDGGFTEFADLMFLEADTSWLKDFFQAREMWIRAYNDVFPGQSVGNLTHQAVVSPQAARRSPKKR